MGDRDQLARDLVGCFPVLDKSDRTDAEATDGPTTAIGKLREAARLMRERAERATPSADPRPGGWAGFGTDADSVGRAMLFGGPAENGYRTGTVLWFAEGCDDCTGPSDADVQHIAGWHPTVALAVAGWLESVAIDDEWEPETAPRIRERTAALAVARAYLGEEANRG